MQTQPSEMVDRVAQAMRSIPLPDAACLNESEWRMLARVAIAAMREPSEEMMGAAVPAMKEVNDRLAFVELRGSQPLAWVDGKPPLYHAWRAMIAAALNESGA